MNSIFAFPRFPQLTLLFTLLNTGADMEELKEGKWMIRDKMAKEANSIGQAGPLRSKVINSLNGLFALLNINNNNPFDERYQKHLDDFVYAWAEYTGAKLNTNIYQPKGLYWGDVFAPGFHSGSLRDLSKVVDALWLRGCDYVLHHEAEEPFVVITNTTTHVRLGIYGASISSLRRIGELFSK